ncbi:hypothetical protein [Seonamhaeicola marinus]|uniref:Uncharacterized protein n=1 Tax=Seonamhaeicola marinus TaxID=1912246 RepID=A0A5D0I412_9FLAO|nr:hypothetical protein [Seonamhaeicola marinus]TYA78406.1 hypothetical protein FUA24_08600 [Seonamhaeicola marinus]
MILDTTYYNKEHNRLLRDMVGTSFSLLEAFKLKGVGSKRMIIEDVSPNLQQYISTKSGIDYANIELRREGILLFINKGLQNFTWAIPYYHLVVFKTNSTSIHAQGKFIRFKNNTMLKENRKFFRKMIEEKVRYEDQYNFQPT